MQSDLDKLGEWEKNWNIKFHPSKCQVLQMTRKRQPRPYDYQLHRHILEVVSVAKYYGVTLTSDLRWK